jgi:diguanylate cyclase (GGDEF)-like protein
LQRSATQKLRLIGVTEGRDIDISEASDELDFRDYWQAIEAAEAPSFRLCAPVVHEERVLGRLCVCRPQRFSERDEDLFHKLIAQFGFLLNYQLRLEQADELALRDPLTGLHNRRYLHQQLEYWIPRAKEKRVPISLFLLDVDHFKSINDTWGHDVGDRVLCLLGGLMNNLFRSDDVVCRFGGEEFAILLCDHRKGGSKDHPTEVLKYAERLRVAAETLALAGDDGQALANITISGGIATYPWDANNAEELLRRADEALYRAKRSGRNRIVFAAPRDASKAG